MRSLVLFNNKGGVGKTTLTFNLAHMLARLGRRVVALDFDPQCNLTSLFLEEDDLVDLWQDEFWSGATVAGCIEPVRRGKGDTLTPILQEMAFNLWFLPGHLSLARFEQPLAEEWPKAFSTDRDRAFDVLTALATVATSAARERNAEYVILDVGPSLGALNRAALLACDAVLIPVAPDLFSLQGLRNAGPVLQDWRRDWQEMRRKRDADGGDARFVGREFRPIGYLIQQHLARADRPVKAYRDWAARIPNTFRTEVMGEAEQPGLEIQNDPYCLGTIKHFASLAPFAHTARKPMFDLKQADGIGGGQIQAVAKCREEFKALAAKLEECLRATPSTADDRSTLSE